MNDKEKIKQLQAENKKLKEMIEKIKNLTWSQVLAGELTKILNDDSNSDIHS